MAHRALLGSRLLSINFLNLSSILPSPFYAV
jgi:hypothetical protein